MENPNYILYKLLLKYHIFENTPELYRGYYSYLYEAVINAIFDEINDNTVVAIRGGGFQGQKIIRCLSTENLKKVKYIIDRDVAVSTGDIRLLYPGDEACFDVVIVGSYLHRSEFEDYYKNKGIVVIDPFTKIIEQMYKNDKSYLEKEDAEYRHITYYDINECIWELTYLNVGTEKYKKSAMKLFSYLIEIKDFYNAEKYLDLYLKGYIREYNNLKSFIKEVVELFNDIRIFIERKKNKDIVINWVDNVCANDCYEMSETKELLANSLVFDNVYTVMPWTHNVFDLILTGKYPIESKFWERKNESYTVENSVLIKMLEDKGYHFIYYSNPGLYSHTLPEKSCSRYLPGFDKLVMGERAMSECSTRHHWNALCDRITHKEPLCCLIHNLSETHDPYVYVGRNTEIKRFCEKREIHMEGIKSIIEQLKWYGRYEKSGQAYQIYMSDHGDFWETKHCYDRNRVNVVLFVKAKNIKPGRVEKLISLADFYKLVEKLISSVDFSVDGLERKYVQIENYDVAFEDTIMNFMNVWREHLMFNMNMLQVRAIITEDGYTYARYPNGREVCYFNGKLLDIEKLEIAEELRKNCGESFIDILENPEFKFSKKLYEYLEVLPEENINW